MGKYRYQHADKQLIVVQRHSKEKPFALAAQIPSRNGVMVSVLHKIAFGEEKLNNIYQQLGPAALVNPWQDDRREVCRDLATPGRKYIIRRYVVCGWDENG